jgi:transcription antitermination protein NusB
VQNVSDLPDFNPEDVIESEVIEHDPAATERSVARRVALQVLYEVDSTQHPVGNVLASRLRTYDINRKTAKYLERTVAGVLENRERLDTVIRQYATEWPLDQMAIVDRNILRMAIYEFAIEATTPVSVTIDEAVALARLFGAEGSIRFVNGVLGTLAAEEDKVREMLGTGDQQEL